MQWAFSPKPEAWCPLPPARDLQHAMRLTEQRSQLARGLWHVSRGMQQLQRAAAYQEGARRVGQGASDVNSHAAISVLGLRKVAVSGAEVMPNQPALGARRLERRPNLLGIERRLTAAGLMRRALVRVLWKQAASVFLRLQVFRRGCPCAV